MDKDRKEYHLLVIEDNSGDYLLIEEYLEEYVLEPHIQRAQSCKEAIEILKKDTNQLDLVLLDLSLPDKSGEELVSIILKAADTCPVIVLTGYSDVQFSIKSLELGATDYLLKDELSAITLYKSLIYNIERRRYINALKYSEKRYSDLFHLSPLPMYVFALDDLSFIDINQAMESHYGYTKEEFLSMKITQIRPDSEVPLLLKTLESLDENNKGGIENIGIMIHQKKTGELMQMEIKSSFLYLEDNKPARLALANDVTQQMHHIKAIEDQNQRLQDIAWTQSHLVRAPVARIIGLVELFNAIGNDDLSKDTINILQYIKTSANDLDHIIKQIVDKTLDKND